MRNLKVRYDKKVVRTITNTDPICMPFEDIKIVMKGLRREKNPSKREKFYFGLYDALLIHWKWCGGTEAEFRQFLDAQRQQLQLPSNIFGQGTGTAGQMQGALDSLSKKGNDELEHEGKRPPKGSSRDKTEGGGGRGRGKYKKSEPSSLSPHVDQGNIRRLTRSLEARICERIRQTGNDDASPVGVVLAPIHFPDVFTRPKNARLWRGGEGVQTVLSGHIVGVWDRSFSMDQRSGSYTKADITRETVCTMHASIAAQHRIRMDHVTYDTAIERLHFGKGVNLTEQLREISGALEPRGGTEAPAGVHAANEIFKEIHSQRRLMILLTDGDLHGSTYSLEGEVSIAKSLNVDICVIGLGTSVDHIRGLIHEQNIFVIDDAMELPNLVDSLVLNRT
jgi:hypothetical protein